MLTPPLARLIQSKVMFLPKVILNYDEPLLSGQPSLRGHLPVPRAWPFNGG